ncbi:hypothetical protein C8R46DRAFT_1344617 [Mycena filopes]|nr:hypothetical protein C8R46DRAFT_1344617 [Mycena filopes]
MACAEHPGSLCAPIRDTPQLGTLRLVEPLHLRGPLAAPARFSNLIFLDTRALDTLHWGAGLEDALHSWILVRLDAARDALWLGDCSRASALSVPPSYRENPPRASLPSFRLRARRISGYQPLPFLLGIVLRSSLVVVALHLAEVLLRNNPTTLIPTFLDASSTFAKTTCFPHLHRPPPSFCRTFLAPLAPAHPSGIPPRAAHLRVPLDGAMLEPFVDLGRGFWISTPMTLIQETLENRASKRRLVGSFHLARRVPQTTVGITKFVLLPALRFAPITSPASSQTLRVLRPPGIPASTLTSSATLSRARRRPKSLALPARARIVSPALALELPAMLECVLDAERRTKIFPAYLSHAREAQSSFWRYKCHRDASLALCPVTVKISVNDAALRRSRVYRYVLFRVRIHPR